MKAFQTYLIVVFFIFGLITACSQGPTSSEETSTYAVEQSLLESGDDDDVLESSVIGIPVASVTVRGVQGGAFPWVVSGGEVELDANGQLEVEVEGLLFAAGPFVGTIGGVTHVSASLTCEGDGLADANGRTTGRVPLSAAGDAEIEDIITLPATCVGPIVLVRVANVNPTTPGKWIAATGF